MRRLRLVVSLSFAAVALLVGSGVASASVGWCDIGCPPPIESGKVAAPHPGMPTPQFQDSNGKFVNNLPPGFNK